MTLVRGGVNPKLPISELETSINHFSRAEDLLIPRLFPCWPLEKSGQGEGQALLGAGPDCSSSYQILLFQWF